MPSNKPAFFFSATQSVDDRLGDIFSFIWASYAGLRELWWQVRGFQREFPHSHIKDIENKFLSGLPLPGGIDLKHICIDSEWEKHESEFSKWLLFEACTLYEGWAEKVCADIFPVTRAGKNAKELQFQNGFNLKGKANGYQIAVNDANSATSALMVAEFLPTLKASKLNCWISIDDHLSAYRFFKECRNAIIHSEGMVSQEILDWYAKLVAIQMKTTTPFKHAFKLPKLVIGQRITLDLRDCALFATIVRRLICTFDAALSVSSASEVILEQRLKTLISRTPKWNSLPSDPAKRTQRIHRMLSASRIPEPVNFSNVMAWMQIKGLI